MSAGYLTRASQELPPDLKQRLALTPGSLTPIDDSAFQQRNTNVRVRHLFKSNGQFTQCQALFTANELLIRDTVLNQVIGQHLFEAGVSIKDVLYLPAPDGSFGVLVACNLENDGLLVRLTSSPGLEVVYKLAVPHKITSARVIFSETDERPALLSKRMASWDNILAIGTHSGHGYIVNVPIDEQWTDTTPVVEKPLTDALRSFQKSGDIFFYRNPSSASQDIRRPLQEVYVSSIGYLSRSCVVLMGLSFGGIIQISLTNSGEISQNMIATTSPIRHIVGMLPHDDPNMHVWFCALAGTLEKGLRLVLYEGFFDISGQENVPVLEREYRNPQFAIKCMESFPKGSKWISAQPLVRERRYGNREEADETLNNVTLNDTDLDYSQMFYSFVGPEEELMCGVFDLNTYYFKRLLPHPFTDSTIAKQCAFLSLAHGPEKLPVSAKTITDMSVDCESIGKFHFAEDPEQLLYISSMDLLKIHVGSNSATFNLALKSLPSQVLDRIYDEDLREHSRKPREAARKLIGVGLMTSMSSQELQTEFSVLMTAALVYGKLPALMKVVRESTEADIPFLRNTNEWLWGEVNRARKNLDSINNLLFSGMKDMSGDQKKQLAQVHRVTNASKKIFSRIHKIFDILAREGAMNRAIAVEVELRLAAVNNLSDYVNCINNLCQHKYIPTGDCALERKELEEGVTARRKARSSGENARQLFIDKVVQKMYDCAPEDDLWLEQSAAEWYPPALHNAVSVLLPYSIPDKLKADFIIYFMCDLVVARKFIGFGKEKSAYDSSMLSVVDILNGVLKLDKDRVSQIFEIWCKETEPVPVEATLPVLNLEPGLEDANSKITTIVANREFLNAEQEKKLKSLCDSVPFGKFRWQLYLMERGRFPEVEILDVAPAFSNEYERLYSQALSGIRRLKQGSRTWSDRNHTAPFLSGNLVGKIKTYDPSTEDEVPVRTRFNPKTPVALFKRVRRVPEKAANAECLVPEDDVTKSPDLKRSRLMEDDIITSPHTPTVPSSLDPEHKEIMASILRTPTSRRARAAAALEHQTGICVTPENGPVAPQPTSILRTPIRKMMSPSRGRLRWDPEFVEESLDSTDIAATMAAKEPEEEEDEEMEEDANETLEVEGDGMEEEESVEVMEDESKEKSYEEQEEEEEKAVEEQPDDSSEEPEEEVEKVVEEMQDVEEEEVQKVVEEQEEEVEKATEEQEEVEKVVEEQEEVEQVTEEQEEEVEKSIEEQEENGENTACTAFDDTEQIYSTMKLVDYSITDSTIMETPPRASTDLTRNCATWITEDGMHHSFEQQPDEKSEMGTPAKVVVQEMEAEKSFEQQAEKTHVSEVVEKSFERQNSEEEPEDEVFEEPKEVEVETKETENTEAPEEGEKSFEKQKEEEQVVAPEVVLVAVEPAPVAPVAVESPVPAPEVEEKKSPSRRGRSRKASEEPASKNKEKSEEPPTPTRRSSRGRSLSTTSSTAKPPVKIEATLQLDLKPASSTRRSVSRTRTPSGSDKTNAHRALFTFTAVKSKDVEMEGIEEEAPKAAAATPVKRGRTPRATAATPPRVTRAASAQPAVEEEKLDFVARFRAKVTKAKEEMSGASTRITRKRATSDSSVPVAPKKSANVPDTINEAEEETKAKPTRSSSRSRTTSRSVTEKEPSPVPQRRTARSPARVTKKETTPEVVPTRKSTRSPSRSRKTEAEAPVAATLEIQPSRRTPSRSKKVVEKEATPKPPAPFTSRRGKSPARAVMEPVVDEKVKRSPGRPRKAASVAPTTTAVLELVPPRRAASRASEVTQPATPGRRGKK